MMRNGPNNRINFLIFLVLLSFFSLLSNSESGENPSPYHSLEFSASHRMDSNLEFFIQFIDGRSCRDQSFMLNVYLNLHSRETTELYSRFFTPETILLFQEISQAKFKDIKDDGEQIPSGTKKWPVAILLVESRFGDNIGKYRVIPTFCQ